MGENPVYSLEKKIQIMDEYHEMFKKPKEEREKIEEFCARHGISSGALYKWLKREDEIRKQYQELMGMEEDEEDVEGIAEKIDQEAEELVNGEELVKEMVDSIQGVPVEEEKPREEEEAVGGTPQATEVPQKRGTPSGLLVWTAVGGLLFVLIGSLVMMLRRTPKVPEVEQVQMAVPQPVKEEPRPAQTVPPYEVVGETDGLPVISPD